MNSKYSVLFRKVIKKTLKKTRLLRFAKKMYFLLSLAGIDLDKVISLTNYKRYRNELHEFERLGGLVTRKHPSLHDWKEQAGTASGHYFHQDLLVAQFVFSNNPIRHIDVGSRVDGFVAHVASFRKIEILDVRFLNSSGHDNLVFKQSNLMVAGDKEITDSLSCLHAIEHFGLGRYGDPLDPAGHIKGFANLVGMLKKNGLMYISFPIGKSTEVHFNAHRVFHPREILNWGADSLELIRFDYVDDSGNLHKNINLFNIDIDVTYGCGIYTFRKR